MLYGISGDDLSTTFSEHTWEPRKEYLSFSFSGRNSNEIQLQVPGGTLARVLMLLFCKMVKPIPSQISEYGIFVLLIHRKNPK